jgi:hypothetical protein
LFQAQSGKELKNMGVVVDFVDGIDVMLDELQETYDGRILSPQGKVIRVLPIAKKKQNGDGMWVFYGQVYVTTLIDDMILLARLETEHVVATEDLKLKWKEARLELDRLAREAELLIEDRGFVIKRGRFYFSGDDDYHKDLIGVRA